LGGRADEAHAERGGVNGRRQDARDGRDPGIERQLPERQITFDLVGRQASHGGQKPERHQQVEMAPLLQDIGGCQVHGDALRRQAKAQRLQGRLHPFAAFGHRLVGQADDLKSRKAGSHMDLDVDGNDVDPLKGHRFDARDHRPPRPARTAGAAHTLACLHRRQSIKPTGRWPAQNA
jgi:hypothetical protein